jgi:hypothetical protein
VWFVQEAIGKATERSVVGTWLRAQRAKQLGLVVSNRAIHDFLAQLTAGRITSDQLRGMFEDLDIKSAQMFHLLRHELLAMRLQQLFNISLAGTTPGQRWDCFTRLKRTAAIEAIAVPVSDYVDKVPDPGEKELRAFFDDHKRDYPLPDSPEPGFRKPHKIAIGYFKADFAKFLKPDEVTDAEIQQRYEENEVEYDRLARQLGEEPTAEDEGGEDEEQAPSAETQEPDSQDTATPKETETEDQTTTATETPAEPAEDEPEREGDASDADDTSAEPTNPPSDESASTDENAEEAAAEVEEPSPEAPKEPVGLTDRLREIIREQIARDKANQEIESAFGSIQEVLTRYRNKYVRYKVDRLNEKDVEPPEKPDFAAMAEKHGLTYDQTPLISRWQTNEFDVGRSYVDRWTSFASYLFDQSWQEYQPAISSDLEGNRYLFWIVNDEKERIPKFDDEGVRQEVLKQWKQVQARSLALDAANALREKARKQADGSAEATSLLEKALPGHEVIKTTPFSWLTQGAVPIGMSRTPPRISDVPGIDRPGYDFMNAVFDLEQGQIGVAMNQSETIAYVVRVTEVAPPMTVLWDQFEVEDFSTYVDVVRREQFRIRAAWQKELEEMAGLKWERKPDSFVETGA